MEETSVINIIKNTYPDVYVDYEFPRPYEGKGEIKAILLGNDPGNNTYGITRRFKHVFALNEDARYFRIFKENLKDLGCITMENLYIQNLCKNYFNCDSSDNKCWNEFAKLWIPYLKQELDSKYNKGIPILVTSNMLLESLYSYDKTINGKLIPKSFYENCTLIDKQDNFFGRDLIPFYRNKEYKLSKSINTKYKMFLRAYFNNGQKAIN